MMSCLRSSGVEIDNDGMILGGGFIASSLYGNKGMYDD